MSAKPVRRYFGVFVLIFVLAAFSVFILTRPKSPATALDELLHGSKNVMITEIEISFAGPGSQRVSITNQTDLAFLTAAFRNASTNQFGLGKGYDTTIYLNNRYQVNILMIIRDDVEYLVIAEPTFMGFSDPAMFRVSLSPLLPVGLSNTLHSIVTK
jgi:hypothetical protein